MPPHESPALAWPLPKAGQRRARAAANPPGKSPPAHVPGTRGLRGAGTVTPAVLTGTRQDRTVGMCRVWGGQLDFGVLGCQQVPVSPRRVPMRAPWPWMGVPVTAGPRVSPYIYGSGPVFTTVPVSLWYPQVPLCPWGRGAVGTHTLSLSLPWSQSLS